MRNQRPLDILQTLSIRAFLMVWSLVGCAAEVSDALTSDLSSAQLDTLDLSDRQGDVILGNVRADPILFFPTSTPSEKGDYEIENVCNNDVDSFLAALIGSLDEEMRKRLQTYRDQLHQEAPDTYVDELIELGIGNLSSYKPPKTKWKAVGIQATKLRAQWEYEDRLAKIVDAINALGRSVEQSDSSEPAYRVWINKKGNEDVRNFQLRWVDFRRPLVKEYNPNVTQGTIFQVYARETVANRGIYYLDLDAMHTLDSIVLKLNSLPLWTEPAKVDLIKRYREKTGYWLNPNWSTWWVERVIELYQTQYPNLAQYYQLTPVGINDNVNMHENWVGVQAQYRVIAGSASVYDVEQKWRTLISYAAHRDSSVYVAGGKIPTQEDANIFWRVLQQKAEQVERGLGGRIHMRQSHKSRGGLRWGFWWAPRLDEQTIHKLNQSLIGEYRATSY